MYVMEERPIKSYVARSREANDKTSDSYLDINSSGLHKNFYFQTIRKKGRSDYQLIYVEQGTLALIEGEEEITLTSGGFVLYRPGEPQNYCQKGGVCYWVHFTGTQAEELLRDAGLSTTHYFQGKRHEAVVTRFFEKLIFHYARRAPLRKITLCSDLIALLSVLGGLIQEPSAELTRDERLRPIVLQMHRDYAKPIDLDAYAEVVGLSRGRFLHLFKAVMGVSPYAYILDLRLSHGAELLLTSSDPISAISFAVGFSDPLYFSRLFKKKYAISPEKFRGKA